MLVRDILFVVVGLAGLFYGGNWLVKGASRLAASWGIEPLIIGVTIVAFGTSAPELLVNVLAAIQGSTDLSIGNIIGSNVSNIGLILGITGLIISLRVDNVVIRREIPILLGVTFITSFFIFSQRELVRVEGVVLVLGFVAFNVFILWATIRARRAGRNAPPPAGAEVDDDIGLDQLYDRRTEILRLVAGIAFLLVGAQLMIDGATSIARDLGISELVIGVTLVAFGTSLPELATSIIAAMRGERDIAIGNVVGSNIANLLAILGITSIIRPISVAPEVINVQIPALLGFTLLFAVFAVLPTPDVLRSDSDNDGIKGDIDRFELVRWESFVLLALYLIYIIISFASVRGG